jgi:hypothetical protein
VDPIGVPLELYAGFNVTGKWHWQKAAGGVAHAGQISRDPVGVVA